MNHKNGIYILERILSQLCPVSALNLNLDQFMEELERTILHHIGF